MLIAGNCRRVEAKDTNVKETNAIETNAGQGGVEVTKRMEVGKFVKKFDLK